MLLNLLLVIQTQPKMAFQFIFMIALKDQLRVWVQHQQQCIEITFCNINQKMVWIILGKEEFFFYFFLKKLTKNTTFSIVFPFFFFFFRKKINSQLEEQINLLDAFAEPVQVNQSVVQMFSSPPSSASMTTNIAAFKRNDEREKETNDEEEEEEDDDDGSKKKRQRIDNESSRPIIPVINGYIYINTRRAKQFTSKIDNRWIDDVCVGVHSDVQVTFGVRQNEKFKVVEDADQIVNQV